MINRSNYKEYMDLFARGELPAEEEIAFVQFLDNNPDISEVLIDEELPAFPLKNKLYKEAPITGENLDRWLVAELEGDLNQNDKKELDSYLELNPKSKNERKLIRLSKFEADQNVVFENRHKLKKFVIGVWYFRASAVAASIILLGALWLFISDTEKNVPVFTEDIQSQPAERQKEINTDEQVPEQLALSFEEEVEVSPKNEAITSAKITQAENFRNEVIAPKQDVPVLAAKTALKTDFPSSEIKLQLIEVQIPQTALAKTHETQEDAPATKYYTPLEWAYSKVRSKIKGAENIPQEKEPAKDAAGIVAYKISELVSLNKSVSDGTSIVIAGIKISHSRD